MKPAEEGLGGHLGQKQSNIEGLAYDINERQVKRGLKSRHAQMLALGGTIGTGLFVGSGQALEMGGPVSLFLAYCVLTMLVFGIVTATTEMGSYLPVPGCSIAYYAYRFVSPSLAFALGWMYWYVFTITVPAEITAATLVIGYWDTPVPNGVWITIIMLLIIAINIMPVHVYGETEFWLAGCKVLGILGLLIMGLVLILGGGPTHQRLGFHYWTHNPGPFKEYLVAGASGRLCGFIGTICYSVFAFGFAPELLVVTGGEMQNARTNLPKAGKRYFYRLVAFYILGVFVIGLIISADNDQLVGGGSDAGASPWAIAAKEAGIWGLDSVINAVILISAVSSGVSYLYMASRGLYSLAMFGHAPKVFKRCTRSGIPYYAIAASGVFLPLAYLNLSSAGTTVFNWFVNLINTGGFLSWMSICLIYLRFRGATFAQGISPAGIPYRSVFQPWASYFCGVVFSLLLLLNGFKNFFPGHWDTSNFLTAYIGILVLAVFYFVYWVTVGRGDPFLRPLVDIDLVSGLEEVIASESVVVEGRKIRWFQVWKYLYQ
ncbi:amino acid permease/ SLC12A domain-containing protein [Aspergillus unguis]